MEEKILDIVLEIIKSVVILFLLAVQSAMTVRAILSWFVMDGGRFMNFLYAITEPFIHPVRLFLEKFNILQNTPIDFSFLITYLIISMITIFL